MDALKNWSARRSGGRITINGTDETGRPVKIPNVDTIQLIKGGLRAEASIVAVDKTGKHFELEA